MFLPCHSQHILIPESFLVAGSWQEAKEAAEREGPELVFHDLDTGSYGAWRRGDRWELFPAENSWNIVLIALVTGQTVEEMKEKESRFLKENPDY